MVTKAYKLDKINIIVESSCCKKLGKEKQFLKLYKHGGNHDLNFTNEKKPPSDDKKFLVSNKLVVSTIVCHYLLRK